MSDHDAAMLINRVHRIGGRDYYGRGYIESVANGQAYVRRHVRSAIPEPGFDVPPWLDLLPGDHVLYYVNGADRIVIQPLDRNARTDWNPTTEAGQIIVAGADGPTVIEPPVDVTVRNHLRWGGDTRMPSWQDTGTTTTPPPPPTSGVPTQVTGLTLFATTSTSIALTWDVASGPLDDPVIGYDVTRDGVLIASPVSPSFSDVGLTPSTAYTYTIEATNTSGNGPASDPLTATTDAATTGALFPRMSIWLPYWKGMSQSKVADVIADFVYMQQNGVVLMGMEWGAQYALPDDISTKLDMFIAAGVTPYLGLWVGHLDADEQSTAQRAWDAGDGKWAGIVLDAEAQWVNHVQDDEAQAHADFDAFMAIVRPLTDLLADACYASPRVNFKMDWWNEIVDVHLPLAYFNSTSDTAALVLNTMYRKFAALDLTHPCKPLVPVMNGYKSTLTDAAVAERRAYIDLALAKSGAVQLWRWDDTPHNPFPDNMREMLHDY